MPVEFLSDEEAAAYGRYVGAPTRAELEQESSVGRKYRLPTEAEWEYACRGGHLIEERIKGRHVLPFHFEHPTSSLSSCQANFDGASPYGGAARGPSLKRTCKVGSYEPNPLGIYDMHGNVWEWCHDWFDESYFLNSPVQDPQGPAEGTVKTYRGGSWLHFGFFCRAAFRSGYTPQGGVSRLGFRVALVPLSPS